MNVVDVSRNLIIKGIYSIWLHSYVYTCTFSRNVPHKLNFNKALFPKQVFSLYEVRVVVFNQLGAGTYSQPYKWTTGESGKK